MLFSVVNDALDMFPIVIAILITSSNTLLRIAKNLVFL